MVVHVLMVTYSTGIMIVPLLISEDFEYKYIRDLLGWNSHYPQVLADLPLQWRGVMMPL